MDKGRLLEDSMRGRPMNKIQIQKWIEEQGYKRVEDITYLNTRKTDHSISYLKTNHKPC